MVTLLRSTQLFRPSRTKSALYYTAPTPKVNPKIARRLEDLLSKRRLNQFYSEFSGCIALVENRVDLHQLQ